MKLEVFANAQGAVKIDSLLPLNKQKEVLAAAMESINGAIALDEEKKEKIKKADLEKKTPAKVAAPVAEAKEGSNPEPNDSEEGESSVKSEAPEEGTTGPESPGTATPVAPKKAETPAPKTPKAPKGKETAKKS